MILFFVVFGKTNIPGVPVAILGFVLTFGAFVELEPGIDGLVHISQCAATRIQKVEDAVNVGDEVKADTFAAGDWIDVTGISKGHGYQGVIKRHGAHRTDMTHGGGPVHRHAGSMGASSHQSRIFPGKIGAGQMGNEQVTIENLEVVKVDAELNMIVIRGAIPGPKGGLVYIRNTVKTHKVKQAGADISKNPQKASGRNPQKASARG